MENKENCDKKYLYIFEVYQYLTDFYYSGGTAIVIAASQEEARTQIQKYRENLYHEIKDLDIAHIPDDPIYTVEIKEKTEMFGKDIENTSIFILPNGFIGNIRK